MSNDTQATDSGTETAEAPKKKKAPPKAADTAIDTASAFGDLDKVRQILFGEESREIHDRFAALEKQFEHKIEALTEAVERWFEAMEGSLKQASDALNQRLNDEQEQRANATEGLGKDIEAVAQALRDNRAQLDEHLAETERALRASLREEADNASKDRTARFDELSAQLEQAVAQLGDAKTDRSGLADLFDELSARLRNSPSN